MWKYKHCCDLFMLLAINSLCLTTLGVQCPPPIYMMGVCRFSPCFGDLLQVLRFPLPMLCRLASLNCSACVCVCAYVWDCTLSSMSLTLWPESLEKDGLSLTTTAVNKQWHSGMDAKTRCSFSYQGLMWRFVSFSNNAVVNLLPCHIQTCLHIWSVFFCLFSEMCI